MNKRWTTLSAEFALVVIGILVALAIDGWVSDRQDRKQERIYLELLVRDFHLLESRLDDQIEFESEIGRAADRAFRITDTANPADQADELGDLLSILSFRHTMYLQSAAYTDLLSTGNLGLIRDRELRDQIVRYFEATERRELVVAKNNRNFVDESFVPFLMDIGFSYHLAALTSNLSSIDEGWRENFYMDENPSMPPSNEALRVPASAPVWPQLRQRLIWRTRHALNTRDVAGAILADTVAIRESIEAHLAK